MLEEVCVDEVLGALMKRRVDGNDVALRHELLEVGHAACVNLSSSV